MRNFVVALVTAVTIVAGLPVVLATVASPASAADTPTCEPPSKLFVKEDGTYGCTDPGTPGTPGVPGTPVEPTCDVEPYAGRTEHAKWDRSPLYCDGETVCFHTGQVIPLAPPKGDPPSEESETRMDWCYAGLGDPTLVRTYWTEDEEPTLLEQAQTAIGNINLGVATVNISPQARTLVNLDTWFWVTGLEQETTGSSAFDLVAIARFRGMEIDPGDGSTFTCDWTTTKEAAQQDCFHEYRRSSVNGTQEVDGRNAFGVTASAVYDLTFEVNGVVTPIDGAQTTLEAPVATAAVRVDEVQSRVVRVR